VRFLSARLPLLTLFASVAVFTLTLILAITSGTGISQPFNLVLILLMALSTGLMFLALNPNNERAALMLWYGAGVWGATAYLNLQGIGLLELLVAVMAAVSAFLIERESRSFSFAGPALFVGVGLLLVVLARFFT
jgi:hypothetical protein